MSEYQWKWFWDILGESGPDIVSACKPHLSRMIFLQCVAKPNPAVDDTHQMHRKRRPEQQPGGIVEQYQQYQQYQVYTTQHRHHTNLTDWQQTQAALISNKVQSAS